MGGRNVRTYARCEYVLLRTNPYKNVQNPNDSPTSRRHEGGGWGGGVRQAKPVSPPLPFFRTNEADMEMQHSR